MDVSIDLATSLAITTLVVGIVFLARLITGPADRSGPWLMGKVSVCDHLPPTPAWAASALSAAPRPSAVDRGGNEGRWTGHVATASVRLQRG
jgi:hypothetical protein